MACRPFRPFNLNQPLGKRIAIVDDFVQSPVDLVIRSLFHDPKKGTAGPAVWIIVRLQRYQTPRLSHQLPLLKIVHHCEGAGHIRLQRKLMQQRFAEGVNGLDLETARGFQGPGKQDSGTGHLVRPGRRLLDSLNFLAQFFVAPGNPVTENLKHPVGHLARRRLGIGQAQDTRGIGTGEQQSHHPLGQHIGLAGTGIGRHPGGVGRIGGAVLIAQRLLVNLERLAHVSPPSSSTTSHSRTRARWS